MRLTAILAAFSLGLLSACRTANPPSSAPAFGVAGLTALLVQQPPRWSSADAALQVDRAAVLVAADRYADHPEWALPGAAASTARLRETLVAHCGVSPRAITELRGEGVHRDAVVAAVRATADAMAGPSAVLFLAYAGHGFVDADGDPLLFGHFTKAEEGGGFRGAIARREIVAAVADARERLSARGVALTVVSIVDACRVGLAAPPPRATLRRAPLWELWGTRPGTYAGAGAEGAAFPFTSALCDAIAALAGTAPTVDLARVAQEARVRTLAATGGEQQPELLGPRLGAEPPAAIVSTELAFRVAVTDAVSAVRLDAFAVRLDSRTFLTDGEGEVLVRALPGTRTFEIGARGYLPREERIEVGRDRAGAVLHVALHPALVLVSGRVQPPAVVAVRAVGGHIAPRANYHLMETVTGRDGAFQLRIPSLDDGMVLEFVADGRVVERVPLPRAPGDVVVASGLPRVPRLDLEVPLAAGGAASLTLDAAGTDARPAEAPRGRDALAQAELERMLDLVRAGRFEMARDALAATVVAASDEDLRQRWLAWLELQAARSQPTHRVMARLAEIERGASSPAVRRAVAEALVARLVESRDWNAVLAVFETRERGPDAEAPAWRQVEQRVLPVAVEQMLRVALVRGSQEGDWTAADRVSRWLLDARHLWVLEGRPDLDALRAEVERERITPACRAAFERANIAFAEGRLEDAQQLFTAAREGANAHYLERIEDRLQQLDVKMFEASMSDGTRHELAGRSGEALAAYAKAYARNPRASESVRRLLRTAEPHDAGFARVYEDLFEHVLRRARADESGTGWAELSRLFATDPRAQAELRSHLVETWADVVDEEVGATGLPRTVRDRESGIVLRLVEPGSFLMGAPASDPAATTVERPRHRVSLGQPFYLGETEVTWAQWRHYATDTGLGGTGEAASDLHPVAGVSWFEARAFCEHFGFRLPTEAEWEFAARAGSGDDYRRFPWGNEPAGAVGNVLGRDEPTAGQDAFPLADGFTGPAPVASFAANAWGFHDLIGNVREWCSDTFDANAYRARAAGAQDPVRAGEGHAAVARGGSYQDGPRTSGIATRLEVARDAHLPWQGLRVVRDAW